ncbi:MAG: bifunctional phosphopantothenoylcysteine decarboxylase/phosphopantothenate--cysteine ligase CoaBC [Chloroflexi bacterium]|nr:bifunctional phosphopantothenoylcysteine decarboxylase/phosphopantothenate--cysteine ligase CoaBC [Chloroflexota bacterium]MBP8058874.1 bifunctional phosphopantothenoylcysteine decarboxylase/phosphopantothenate--cysteine ligase CoaBC [Chloroflexota bacterium]
MPYSPFTHKHIVLGVTGSIAAYKTADLASKLTQAGALVDVILTESASRFVTPLTFQAVTGRPVYTDLWAEQGHIRHVALGEKADLLVIAPATAHTIAKLAHGLADNLLTVTTLATRGPVLVAPAMDGGMFAHPATQANIQRLKAQGVTIIGPAEGRMASGLVGLGRMVEPAELLAHIRLALARDGVLRGRKFIITAGPTQEPLDPVRYLTNYSSGKQGVALAQAALDAGADVTLIAGPLQVAIPQGIQHIPVQTAEQMKDAVLSAIQDADALLMAAAVADFRPATRAEQKIKKTEQGSDMVVELTRNPDILAAVKAQREQTARPRLVLGFAAETQDVLAYGQDKLVRKGLDFIAVNDVSRTDAGFATDTNEIILLGRTGIITKYALQDKADIAVRIVAHLAEVLTENSTP